MQESPQQLRGVDCSRFEKTDVLDGVISANAQHCDGNWRPQVVQLKPNVSHGGAILGE
jgi:hypothetical protein